MKNIVIVSTLALFYSFSSLAGVQNLNCTLAGDALDTLEFSIDPTTETITVNYSFMSGEEVEFTSERESQLFNNGQLSPAKINFLAFNGDSFAFGGAYFSSALVIMNEVANNGARDVLVSANGTVYTGSCK